MLQQNFYPGKAIQVWNNNDGGTSSGFDADIPNPSYIVPRLAGITVGPSINSVLIDAGANFLDDLAANKFAIGDTVYQPKGYKHSRIVSVDSQIQLTVADPTFFPALFVNPVSYRIYRKSPYGCLIFAQFNKPATQSIEVTDLNNNSFVLAGFQTSSQGGQAVLPFQCRKLIAANTDTALGIYALFQ